MPKAEAISATTMMSVGIRRLPRFSAREHDAAVPNESFDPNQMEVQMDDVTIARTLHVLSVILWIGGVGFVATVLLPSVRRLKAPHERMRFFDAVERRFAWQARIWTVLAGLTGLYMLGRLDLWDRFRYAAYWWMHAMIAVWLLFTVVLFVAEPLFLHRWLLARVKAKPQATFRLLEWLHWVWLILSLVTVAGAVAGTHGLLLFE
jgi:uncharacterized membrane protein